MNRLRKHALDIAAFLWGVAEATLFFIVPDVLLSYIGVKHGVKSAVRASVIATIGAAAGGAIMYLWSARAFADAYLAVLAVPAIGGTMAEGAEQAMAQNWFIATLLGPLSSTPYKLYAVLAPSHAPLLLFLAASVLARLPRFLAVSIGVALIGRFLSRWLSERQLLWVLIGAWVLFYAVFFTLMPN